jgi:5-amino-6-(5-phosphoribosylamino)uracil reductase
MGERPYTLLSCSISLDGYLDDGSDTRLLLSNDADFDRVDAVRAEADAILVGAATVRRDNPRLVLRDPDRSRARAAAGRPPDPTKVTVTRQGDLDPCARFFATGGAPKLVYCPRASAPTVRDRLGGVATVVEGGADVTMRSVSEDLHHRGVRRLMVEGGGSVHTQFLTDDLADELHLVVAPLFVGDPRARRFVDDGRFPWRGERRAELVEARPIGDVVLLRYAMSSRFRER